MPSISLPALSLAVGVAGAGMQAAGTYGQYQAQSATAGYQAQVAANNAKIALQNESMEIQSGEQQATNEGMKNRAILGQTKAAQAASGVDVNSGSFVGARAGEAEIGQLNTLTIRSNAARRAYGYAVSSTNDTAQSELLTSESKQASEAAPFAAAGSLLSSASSAGGRYAMWNNAGGSNPTGSGNPLSLNPADY